jgi:hypothetical protein
MSINIDILAKICYTYEDLRSFKMALHSLRPPGSSSSTAPTTGASPSGGGGSSGKNSVNIPAWIMPIGIAYLIIRGLFIIGRNYITIFYWVIIAILAFFAILSFWNGKNRWLSLVLIVAIGCIIWFNQAHIDSFKQQSTSPTEQSARQEQVNQSPSPIPTPEAPIARERIAQIPGKVIVLTKSKTITLPPGQKDICFSWLGDSTGRWNQSLEIGNQTFSTQGSNCFPVTQEGSVEVKFINPPQTEVDTYQFVKKQIGGQGEYPFIKLNN